MRIQRSFRIPPPLRLASVARRMQLGRRRVPGRPPAIERVMRRSAVLSQRNFTAQLRLQALLSTTVIRQVLRSTPVRQLRDPEIAAHAILRRDSTRIVERLLQQRMLQRITRIEGAASVTTVPPITRVEQRHAPRIQMTLVRAQPAAVKASASAASVATTEPDRTRPAPSQPRLAPPAAPLVLPPQELSRLTDHVIRQLDHRVLSWQERTGRV